MTGLTDAEREQLHRSAVAPVGCHPLSCDCQALLSLERAVENIVAAREAAAEERGRAEVRAAVEAVRSDADWLADWSHSPPAGVLFGDLARMTRLAYGVRAALGGDPAAAVAAIKADYADALADDLALDSSLTDSTRRPTEYADARDDERVDIVLDIRDRAAALRGEAGA